MEKNINYEQAMKELEAIVTKYWQRKPDLRPSVNAFALKTSAVFPPRCSCLTARPVPLLSAIKQPENNLTRFSDNFRPFLLAISFLFHNFARIL